MTFPKVWHLGTKQVERLYVGPIECTEKVDGSQFSFGVGLGMGGLYMRSKGAEVLVNTQDKLFSPVANYVSSIFDKLDSKYVGWWFSGETLANPGHNTLKYNRVPKNHFALFAARMPDGTYVNSYSQLFDIAADLDVDVVPLLFSGESAPIDLDALKGYLDRESFLGGPKIEGIVIKNYTEQLLIGGQLIPILCAKYVSEEFKEKHSEGWASYGDKWQLFMESFRTEARWRKAVQHVRERGELQVSPKDIGNLLKEVNLDFIEESKQEWMEGAWKHYWKDQSRVLTRGFPEWYKEELVKGTYNAN